MRKRWSLDILVKSLGVTPVVVVTGARQTGKTTLVRDLLADPTRTFVTLDDLGVLAQAERDPEGLLASIPVTVDEVQRCPRLILSVKKRVDDRYDSGMVILTGSANLALMERVSDSLAGRALYLELPPFCPVEWHETVADESPLELLFSDDFDPRQWPTGGPPDTWAKWLLMGGLPPVLKLAEQEQRALWIGGYVQTYLERDLRQLSDVASLPDFERLMRLAANRVGRLLNQSELGRDAGIKQATAHRFLNLLETGYQLVRLESVASNPSIPIVKSKKLFFTDPGVAAWLAGIGTVKDLERRPDFGFWLEQALYPSVAAWSARNPTRRRTRFWRDRKQREVDFVLEGQDRIVALEVKASRTVDPRDFDNLRALAQYLSPYDSRPVRQVVLCQSEKARKVGSDAYALPLMAFFPQPET